MFPINKLDKNKDKRDNKVPIYNYNTPFPYTDRNPIRPRNTRIFKRRKDQTKNFYPFKFINTNINTSPIYTIPEPNKKSVIPINYSQVNNTLESNKNIPDIKIEDTSKNTEHKLIIPIETKKLEIINEKEENNLEKNQELIKLEEKEETEIEGNQESNEEQKEESNEEEKEESNEEEKEETAIEENQESTELEESSKSEDTSELENNQESTKQLETENNNSNTESSYVYTWYDYLPFYTWYNKTN